MPRLYLIRHGAPSMDREKASQEYYERPLLPLGEAQARAAGQRLARASLSAIYCSDMVRAQQTARYIGEACGLPIISDPALREIGRRSWSRGTPKTLDEQAAGYTPGPVGDGAPYEYAEIAKYVRGHVGGIVDSLSTSEGIALVIHSGMIRMLVEHALGLGLERHAAIRSCAHGSISMVRIRDGRWSVETYNDTGHLVGLEITA
jgi:broad specificity phosphatase PhoE